MKLQRTTQTVGIPMFQFGVFCDSDCSFFPGPNFNFGGRTHTNGNLFLAAGATLWLSDKVTVVKDIVRTNLSNGFPTNCRAIRGNRERDHLARQCLLPSLGIQRRKPGTAHKVRPPIPTGPQFLRAITTATSSTAKTLNLGIVTLGTETKPIDIIRRPPPGDSPVVTQQRYFAQASVHILLSDNPTDIMNMPCIDPTTQPFELRKLAQPMLTLQANPRTHRSRICTAS